MSNHHSMDPRRPTSPPVVLITPGDPAGIGPEIVIKALDEPKLLTICHPVVVGDAWVIQEVSHRLRLVSQIHPIDDPARSTFESKKINVIDVRTDGIGNVTPGQPQALAARSAVVSIRKAVKLALENKAEAIVTGPINKEALKLGGYPWIGHTEMLQDLAKSERAMTMFVTGSLRIFFATRHVSLRQAIELLKEPLLYKTVNDTNLEMRKLGFLQPRLAVAALNPHAGDAGLFGREETEDIEPAIRRAHEAGIRVHGPIPADVVFHQCLMGVYDAVIALTHDQGHIAAKTLDFHRTISVTLGLPFIRTSVDHGTAFDIAWRGEANPASLKEALMVAVDLVQKRRSVTNVGQESPYDKE